jgi:hypothetical protein
VYINTYMFIFINTYTYIMRENKIVLVVLSEETMRGRKGQENVKRKKNIEKKHLYMNLI